MDSMAEKIAVIGLGYVGLPVALAFARKFPGTVGFDIDARRVADLRRGVDWTDETASEELTSSPITFSHDEKDLKGATFFVVCVPTPIDGDRRPDFRPLLGASKTVGGALAKGAVVVYESTVYPGATEDICGPVLEKHSGLTRGKDFKLGYSPERINPGDTEHTLERITKVVSGEDAESTRRIADAYGAIITAGVHVAPTIKVAEAAKVIENTQRDLNIALMNELAVIFERLGIRTHDVLAAAGTKWNFLRFAPGLVGGHCIGVDPYYLTAKAEAEGYHPHVILAGRRINDGMGAFVVSKLVRMMADCDKPISRLRVGILGLAFKENVRDLRNSRVPDIVRELRVYGITPLVCDPLADHEQAHEEYGIRLASVSSFKELDAVILAVPHKETLADPKSLYAMLRPGGALIDVKSALNPGTVPSDLQYWSL
jgi:UDP-N-acetyl-D-galactosamine dehydrogenase